MCADFTDIGHDAEFTADQRATYACRPIGLKRAVRNVIENAVRYGVRARIEQSDTAFRIILEDEGPGIPEARLESVFEPFIRLDESRNMESGGIGLGLSIVRSIVQSHGGDVILENREEGGLRVTIALPLD